MSGLSKTDVALQALLDGGDPELAVTEYAKQSNEGQTDTPILQSMMTPKEDAIEGDEQDAINQDATDVGVEESTGVEFNESSNDADSESQVKPRIIEVKADGRKLNVDLNDEEKVSKYIKMAMGARKWQAERDNAINELGTTKKELGELREFEQLIQGGFEQDGVRGVIAALAGDANKFEEFMEAEYRRRRAKEDASPAELELIETREQLEREKRQRELFERKQQELTEKQRKEAEETETQKYRNLVTPAFNKWRMAGKLGDATLEADIDSLIWSKAKAELKKLPEHIELTDRIVEREFRKASTALRKVVDKETTTKVKQVMDKKKQDAQSKAAMVATRGLPKNNNNLEQRAKDSLKGSNNTMEAFAKYFGLK